MSLPRFSGLLQLLVKEENLQVTVLNHWAQICDRHDMGFIASEGEKTSGTKQR